MPDTSSDELPDSTILESISENLSHLNKENHLQNNLKCKVKKKKKRTKRRWISQPEYDSHSVLLKSEI